MDDLAKQLVAAPWWRWAPGMVFDANTPPKLTYGEGRGRVMTRFSDDIPPGAVPDLSDPATVGCLLAMLPLQFALFPTLPGGWYVQIAGHSFGGPTMGEAVAYALLGCPRG